MSKKLLLLISFVLLFSLVGSTSAADKFDYRVCWWSDLGPGHDWNEPNNWYTMDRFWDDVDDDNDVDTLERKYYVKVHPNQVPDINCVALIGKGNARVDYPEFLHDNPPAFDPTISSGTVVAGDVLCSGGYSLDPNKDGGGSQGAVDGNQNDSWWDPCMHHELTINGGTLNVGTPQTWEGYDTQYGYGGYFNGMWGGNCLRIGTVGWYTPELGEGNGQGTMHMNDGTVNVGGHMELGAWEQTIGTLNMAGGTINITQGLCCPAAPWSATGRVNLSGGTINAGYIFINNFYYSTGSIDITAGKFILSRGNEVQKIQDYYDGVEAGASITIYGGISHGDIVTDDVNFPDANGKRVAFSLDYSVSNDGKTTVQTFLTDPNQAWAPSPPDGAAAARGTIANIARPVLSWSAGDNATSHEVYFSTSESLVDTRNASALKQSVYDPCSWTVDSDLVSLGTYYWAIDENPGPTLGQVWSFTMADLSKASLPSPGDGEVDVSPAVDLSWVAGIYAVTHDVYFGTNSGDVNDATKIPLFDPNNVFMGNQGPNTFDTSNYDANGLEFSTTYYWRVDECNSGGLPLWPGDVWSFTTSDHITVDNFESYVGPAPLHDTWHDWATASSGTGQYNAEVLLQTDPNHGGSSSMEYRYNNVIGPGGSRERFSESWADASALGAGTDWTVGGAEALVLYFYGSPDNTADPVYDRMWVGLEDGSGTFAMVHCDDMNDVDEPSWHEWNIKLQDFNDINNVDLTNVNKMYIGFGVRDSQSVNGTNGTVYFDDIEIWPIRCVPAETTATDFTGDCVVDEQDFDIMAGDWLLTDYNTIGYAGTLRGFLPDDDPNGPHWVTGRIGTGALEFGVGHYRADPNAAHPGSSEPPIDDDVLIPPLELNTNKMSATCWIKRHGMQWDDTAWWGSNFHHGEFADVGSTTCHFTVSNRTAESLGINWNNEGWSWQYDPILPVLPNNDWAFCAVVVEPTNATIYIKPDGQPNLYSDSPSKPPTVAVLAFDTPSTVGSNKWRYIDGVIDDLRIFDYSLSLAEVQWLAFEGGQGTEPNLPFSWYKFDDGSGFVAEDSGGGGIVYHKVLSKANLVDPEPEYSRSVNFRDYVLLARDWLKEPTWPRQW